MNFPLQRGHSACIPVSTAQSCFICNLTPSICNGYHQDGIGMKHFLGFGNPTLTTPPNFAPHRYLGWFPHQGNTGLAELTAVLPIIFWRSHDSWDFFKSGWDFFSFAESTSGSSSHGANWNFQGNIFCWRCFSSAKSQCWKKKNSENEHGSLFTHHVHP